MAVGQFVFMLHSHLPYYRKAGMWPFGEENLYECMAETYVPLLNAISELYDEGFNQIHVVFVYKRVFNIVEPIKIIFCQIFQMLRMRNFFIRISFQILRNFFNP